MILFTQVIIVLVLEALQSTGGPRDLVQRNVLWVTQGIQWHKAPKQVNARLRTGEATVLYFGSNKMFGIVDCVINREGDNWTISHGDGQNAYKGEWSEQGDALAVRYRLVYRTVRSIGEILPGPQQMTIIQITQEVQKRTKRDASPRIIFRGRVFVPAKEMRVEDVLSYLPADARHPPE